MKDMSLNDVDRNPKALKLVNAKNVSFIEIMLRNIKLDYLLLQWYFFLVEEYYLSFYRQE